MDSSLMDNSLKLGQYFLSFLESNSELMQLLGANRQNKIFPLIAKEGTQYPLVIYTRESISTRYTKPTYPVGGWDNTVSISYRIYSDKYDEALEIANLIRNILEGRNYKDQNIVINHVELVSCYESFVEDAFVQTLTFSTMVE